MTENTSPRRRPNYSRPTKYPVSLAVMMSERMKREIEDAAAAADRSKAEIVRERLELGSILLDAYTAGGTGTPDLMREGIRRLARQGNHGESVTEGDAIRQLLVFGLNEIEKRERRDREIATRLALSMAEEGIPFDGVSIE